MPRLLLKPRKKRLRKKSTSTNDLGQKEIVEHKNDLNYRENNPYLKKVVKLKSTINNWDKFFSASADETRMNDWIRLEVLGEPLAKKFAWAIPDEKAIKVLANFSPLIEIGCGKAYWSYLLKKRGVDIISCDRSISPKAWTEVHIKGPKDLKTPELQNRNLFLCYPDEDYSLGSKCLKYFTGEYIVHVGETIHTGTLSAGLQAPWGRTSGSDFQVQLSESFHCLLRMRLPCFPFSNDYLSVWKRSRVVSGDESTEGEEATGGDMWRDVPVDERLPDAVAPCLGHLFT